MVTYQEPDQARALNGKPKQGQERPDGQGHEGGNDVFEQAADLVFVLDFGCGLAASSRLSLAGRVSGRRRMAEVACGHFRFPRQLLRILVESLGKKCTSTRFGGNSRIVRFW
jgi:hypothetical protein